MDHLKSTSLKQLEQMYKKEKDPKVKTKLLVVIHKKERRRHKEISKSLKVSDPTIKRTVARFRKEGLKGLYRKHAGGNPGYLKDSQKNQVITYIESEAPTSKQINAYINENFGKSFHPFAMPKFLRSLGFSRITPRKRHYKADKAKQNEWKNDFKKSPRSIWARDTKSSLKTKQ